MSQRWIRLIANRVDVHGELDKAVGVAPLVVVPRHELDECRREHDASSSVEDRRVAVTLEIGGDDLVLGVAKDALVLRCLGLGLDERLDGVVGGLLLKLNGQINHRHIGSWHTESHAGELAVEGREHLAHSLGGTGGRRNDVLASAAAAAPVLARRSVDGLLGGGRRVHGGHETLDNLVLLVDNLGERCKAVGGARGIGQDIDVLGVRCVVHRHHEHRGIRRRSRDDDLLGTTLQVSTGLVDGGEDAGRLAHDIGTSRTPGNLLRVAAREERDGVTRNNQLACSLIVRDFTRVDTVGGVVLEEVRGVFHIAERVVHGDDGGALLLASGTAHEAANATETGDTHLDHGC
mmetsp:Transcript_15783/g.34260  ORF Transcript_15783/g.34260 Transcript_15783/m.34260 type:complete len:348 (-) Transcript_15783:75-1118(-)